MAQNPNYTTEVDELKDIERRLLEIANQWCQLNGMRIEGSCISEPDKVNNIKVKVETALSMLDSRGRTVIDAAPVQEPDDLLAINLHTFIREIGDYARYLNMYNGLDVLVNTEVSNLAGVALDSSDRDIEDVIDRLQKQRAPLIQQADDLNHRRHEITYDIDHGTIDPGLNSDDASEVERAWKRNLELRDQVLQQHAEINVEISKLDERIKELKRILSERNKDTTGTTGSAPDTDPAEDDLDISAEAVDESYFNDDGIDVAHQRDEDAYSESETSKDNKSQDERTDELETILNNLTVADSAGRVSSDITRVTSCEDSIDQAAATTLSGYSSRNQSIAGRGREASHGARGARDLT